MKELLSMIDNKILPGSWTKGGERMGLQKVFVLLELQKDGKPNTMSPRFSSKRWGQKIQIQYHHIVRRTDGKGRYNTSVMHKAILGQ